MTRIERATLADIAYIDDLRKKEGHAVGFIPKQRYEMEIRRERLGSLFVAVENDDRVGFIYATHGGGCSKIQQIAIQRDARLLERGRLLVDAIRQDGLRRSVTQLGCRCAADLESVGFWKALGFDVVGENVGIWLAGKGESAIAQSGRKIIVFRKQLELPLFHTLRCNSI